MHTDAELEAMFAKQQAERSDAQVIYDTLVYEVLKGRLKVSGKDLIDIKDLLDDYRKAITAEVSG